MPLSKNRQYRVPSSGSGPDLAAHLTALASDVDLDVQDVATTAQAANTTAQGAKDTAQAANTTAQGAKDTAQGARVQADLAAGVAGAASRGVTAESQSRTKEQALQDARLAVLEGRAGFPDTGLGLTDQTVAGVLQGSGKSAAAVRAAVHEPASDIVLRSENDRFADTKRLHITSFQKGEQENNWAGGESIWLDTNARAKSMIAWRLPAKPGTGGREVMSLSAVPRDEDFKSRVWAGAHYFAQDQVDNDNPRTVHGHWSVEVPDPDPNLSLRTRFEIKFVDEADLAEDGLPKVGVAAAQIFVGLSDFNIRVQEAYGGKPSGMLRIGGQNQKLEKLIEFNLSESGNLRNVAHRWRMGMDNAAEGSGNVGNDFVIRPYQNNGLDSGTAVHITRSTGNVLFGGTTSRASRVAAEWSNGGAFGFEAHPANALTSGAAFRGSMKAAQDGLLDGRLDGAGVSLFRVTTDGAMEWGPGGSASRDTFLSRLLANRLGTSGEFEVQNNLRIGVGNTGGGARGVIALANASQLPTGQNNAGGLIYVQDGALKYRGSAGTVTTIAAA